MNALEGFIFIFVFLACAAAWILVHAAIVFSVLSVLSMSVTFTQAIVAVITAAVLGLLIRPFLK